MTGRGFHPTPTKKCGQTGWHSDCPHASPVKRSPVKRSRKPIPKVNKKRGGHRFPKNVDEPFKEWMRANFRCLIAGHDPKIACPLVEPAQVAHIKSRGAGGKDVGETVPLCAHHHLEQHRIGVKSFAEKYGLDLKAAARWYAEQYRAVPRSGATP